MPPSGNCIGIPTGSCRGSHLVSAFTARTRMFVIEYVRNTLFQCSVDNKLLRTVTVINSVCAKRIIKIAPTVGGCTDYIKIKVVN